MRDASDGRAFTDEVEARFHYPVDVLSGAEEARLQAVYDRRVGGRVLTFRFTHDDRALRDNETATTWRLADGVAINGPLAGRRLTRVAAHSAFWFGWQGFFPRSDVWHAEPAGRGEDPIPH